MAHDKMFSTVEMWWRNVDARPLSSRFGRHWGVFLRARSHLAHWE